MESTRIDKWLWAARFFKTRSLASHAIELGRVLLNNQRTKPAQKLSVGDLVEIHQAELVWQVHVVRILEVRGSASIAQTLYVETAESAEKRRLYTENRRYQSEPAAQLPHRPTKRQRRQLNQLEFDH
ncbi:RNA-binding S4 domain-containing protein [Undibacterium fentianense]|uniref:RNA-binding S4 domain-containing protein n=1 Tax=Undibacterium fentianense TaxID=2828728 RepID=A0A941DY87_9BURK|nr:RNA-binding S4 domain-containing protein [Undibacterium fentianense]MBR7799644.1 RNA-binding S4 domain-containing protein [Undibacterium fentianense]